MDSAERPDSIFRGRPGLPSVTIMIPTKNNQETIYACLESLLKLDYPSEKLQILVLDSSAPALVLPEALSKRTALYHRDCSPPAAYNFLIPLAIGEIVAFIDSDAAAE